MFLTTNWHASMTNRSEVIYDSVVFLDKETI